MKLSPAWFLFLFAPITVEYLTGSSPYLNPFVLFANLLLYGAGTLLIRELKVRWRKGWSAIFLMAPAYLIAEEGLMLNTLFDPTRNTVGRWLGVNWVWATGMLVVHSLLSLFLPILIAEALYHRRSQESWIKPKTCWFLLGCFCANVFVLGRVMAPAHRPGAGYELVEGLLIVACLFATYWSPTAPTAADPERRGRFPSARRLYYVSLFGTTATLAVGFAAPTLPLPAVVQMAAMLTVWLAFLALLKQVGAFTSDLAPIAKFAVAAGMITFWIVVSPLTALAKRNPGLLVLALLMSALLWNLRKRLIEQSDAVPPLTPTTA